MRIVIDNNIVLDALLERKPFFDLAAQIMTACADEHKGCLTTNSLTDIFYVLRKLIGTTRAKSAIIKLTELFEIISVNEEDCIDALSLPIDDFEDALVAVCAEKIGADYIVTRDELFLKQGLPIAVVSPDTLVEIF